MRLPVIVLVVLIAGSVAAGAAEINLRNPPQDVFGNEPSNAITAEPTVLINKMTEQEMLQHKSIGSQYARQVITNRPYDGIDDFKLRSGLPAPNFDKLKPVLDF
jgi:DNA uptake protein ComE-like DNA-binding protein